MKLPFNGWWCGYWEEAKPNRSDHIDGGTSCPTHERNDGGTEDRGCVEVVIAPLSALVLAKTPCPDLAMHDVRYAATGGCPGACGGSGSTWPDELMLRVGEPLAAVFTQLVPNSAWEPIELGRIVLDALDALDAGKDTQ